MNALRQTMHQRKKLRLRDWLVQKINEGKYGLKWVGDPKERTFRVPWKHGSRHGWSVGDAALFQAWALYTGKYKEGRDIPDPRKWKTNFRCALNALPDIKEIRGKSCPRGKDAFKIYRMTRPFRGRGRWSTAIHTVKNLSPSRNEDIELSSLKTVIDKTAIVGHEMIYWRKNCWGQIKLKHHMKPFRCVAKIRPSLEFKS